MTGSDTSKRPPPGQVPAGHAGGLTPAASAAAKAGRDCICGEEPLFEARRAKGVSK